MTRRTIAILIALAIMIASAPIAFASTLGSTGSIVFSDAGDPGIVDPKDPGEDPDLPGGWDNTKWGTRDLDFGNRKLDLLETKYYKTYSSNDSSDYFYDNGVGADAYDAAAVNKQNSLMVLSAQEKWQVTVSISEFRNVVTNNETMDGFILTLQPNANSRETYDAKAGLKGSASLIEVSEITITKTSSAAEIVVGARGLHGFDFRGILEVPANTAHEGNARATLTWTYGPSVQP